MKTYAVLALFSLAFLTGAKADITIVSDIKSADIESAEMGNMTMKLANGKVRVDTGPAHIIILPSEKKMLIIVDAQKMVMVKSLDDPTQSPNGGEPPTIERTGKTEKISGYDCQQILLKDKKGRITELWVSSAAPDMAQFASSFKALVSANPKKSGFDWTGVMSQKDLNTYPIRSIQYSADGKEEMRITVLSINQNPVPASEFVAPAGYMEMKMPNFGGVDGTDVGASSPSSAPANPMLEMQRKMKNGQAPSQEDIQKMQDMAKQMQQQMQNK